jgi:hypothetical protein
VQALRRAGDLDEQVVALALGMKAPGFSERLLGV